MRRPRRSARFAATALAVAVLGAACSRETVVAPVDASVLVASGGTAQRIEGPLRTRGTDIVDRRGRTVRFLGVADGRMNPGNGNERNDCDQVWRAPRDSEYPKVAEMGFNVVRLGITWANIEPEVPTVEPGGDIVHHWNETYLTALDEAIEGFHSNGVAVILDMHQAGWSPAFNGRSDARCEGSGMPVWLYPRAASMRTREARCNFFADRNPDRLPVSPIEGFEAVWSMLAERYRHTPAVVAADLLNEPPSPCNGYEVATMYDRVGRAVRDVHPDLLLIFEDNAWTGYKENGFLLPRPLKLDNVVYSWHFYPESWEEGKVPLQQHLDRAREWDMPLYIGEFNAFDRATDEGFPPDWAAQLEQFLAYAKSNGISWTIWEYGHGRNSAVVDRKGQIKTDLVATLQRGF